MTDTAARFLAIAVVASIDRGLESKTHVRHTWATAAAMPRRLVQ